MRTRCALLTLLAMSLLAGCSNDRKYYPSTVSLPLDYEIIDPYSHDVVWAIQVPVQHELMVDMDRADEHELTRITGRPAQTMKWAVYREGKRSEALMEGQIGLPGTPILERLSYRPAPERPDSTVPLIAPSPAYGPAVDDQLRSLHEDVTESATDQDNADEAAQPDSDVSAGPIEELDDVLGQ